MRMASITAQWRNVILANVVGREATRGTIQTSLMTLPHRG